MHLSKLAGLACVLDQPLWHGVSCWFTNAHRAAAPRLVALVITSTYNYAPPLMVLLFRQLSSWLVGGTQSPAA